MWNPFKKTNKPEKHPNQSSDTLELKQSEEIDVTFARNFNDGGGHFLYCQNEQDTITNLQKIIEFEKISKIFCFNDNLCAYTNSLNVSSNSIKESDFYFIECSHLIAYDGSIMVTSKHTKGLKLNELGNSYIVLAHPDQIIENSSEALREIKLKNKELPKYISSLKLNYNSFRQENSKSKNIYLLLVESR